MEKRDKLIIIGFFILIIAIIAGMALYMFSSQPTQIDVLGNGKIEEGGSLTVKLSTLDGNGLKNKKVRVIVVNSNDKVVLNKSVKTNSKGKATVDLEKLSKGKYSVNVTFDGDENYSSNTTSKNIKIIGKKVVETTVPEVTQTYSNEPAQDVESDDEENDPLNGVYEEYSDGHGGKVHQFNWDGWTEYDYDDGHYVYEYDDGHVESGYYPGHGP